MSSTGPIRLNAASRTRSPVGPRLALRREDPSSLPTAGDDPHARWSLDGPVLDFDEAEPSAGSLREAAHGRPGRRTFRRREELDAAQTRSTSSFRQSSNVRTRITPRVLRDELLGRLVLRRRSLGEEVQTKPDSIRRSATRRGSPVWLSYLEAELVAIPGRRALDVGHAQHRRERDEPHADCVRPSRTSVTPRSVIRPAPPCRRTPGRPRRSAGPRSRRGPRLLRVLARGAYGRIEAA